MVKFIVKKACPSLIFFFFSGIHFVHIFVALQEIASLVFYSSGSQRSKLFQTEESDLIELC